MYCENLARNRAKDLANEVNVLSTSLATEKQRRIVSERGARLVEDLRNVKQTPVSTNRYIAVDTAQEQDSTGAKSVMIYDTQTQKVVGDRVYDVKQDPIVGTLSKIDTYSAEYVGTGG
jgi:hypothetical protein